MYIYIHIYQLRTHTIHRNEKRKKLINHCEMNL
uniref:Uncharacterized protein n=1 Tax=Glossina morsitans morsitans TaxID=37546 RepID=A0ABK9NH15_GLOMM